MDSLGAYTHSDAFIPPTFSLQPNTQPAQLQPQPQPHNMLPLAVKHNQGRKYTANDWEVVRPEITSLYENATLETVRKIMRERGFDASLKQYKDRIKKWGHKKNIQPDEMEAMVRKQQKRFLQGKRSAFRLRGRPVDPAKIARYEKEHAKHHFDANEDRDIEENMSPAATPSAISCYTPPDMGPPSPHAAPSPYITTSPQPSFSCRSTHTGSHSSGPYQTLPRPLLVAQATSSFQKQPMPSLPIVKSPTSSYSTTIELDDSIFGGQRPASFSSTSTGQSHDTLQNGAVDIMYLHDYEHVEDTQNSKNETGSKWEARSEYQFPADEASIEREVSYGNDVERILSEPLVDSSPSGSLVCSRSQNPDLAMIAPSSIRSPLLEFSAPVFIEFTKKRNRRVLVDHFCNVLSHLIVFKEDTGNPFRQLVLPLSHASSPVMNAIFALSSAHLEYRGIENEEKSLDFHVRALEGLAQLIEQNEQSHKEEILGAIMLLVYYEVLVQRGNTNIVNGHLKGAMTIMKFGPQVSTPTSLFLERAFRFYDVIAALSLGTPPNSDSQPTIAPFPFPSPPDSEFLNSKSPLSTVDALLGLLTDLWPIIHRLSHLLSFKISLEVAIAAGEVSKATVLRTELESTSQAIEISLTKWKARLTLPTSNDDDDTPAEALRIQSILHNAEAYRHSAFVYLYRTIRSLPRSHPCVQEHAHLSLLACSNVVFLAQQCQNGPMTALLWPLFVAACEATLEEDRELASGSFAGMEKRQGMNNIMKAWEVVQEVWRRVDLREDKEVNWRDICEERGFNIVLG